MFYRLRRIATVVVFAAGIVAAGTDPRERLKQAAEAQQAGRLDEAINGYRSLIRDYPKIPELHSNLGTAYAARGSYQDAIAAYKASLALRANEQVKLNLALAYYKSADFEPAISILKEVHAAAPANTQATLLLADCYLRFAKYPEVIALLTPMEKAHPDEHAYQYLLGTALVRSGKAAEGQMIIDRILKNGDSAEARLLMGTTKFMVRDFSGALEDLSKAVELNSKLPEVYAYYGQALMVTGDQAGARGAFEKQLAADPNNFDANLQMGVLMRQDQENARALEYLEHALKIRPGDYGVRYQIAALRLAEGNLDAAERELRSLIADSPDFLEAHVSLATVYFREKKKAEGERERAVVAKLNEARRAANEIAAQPKP